MVVVGVSESVSLGSVPKVMGLKKDDENDNEDEEKIVEESQQEKCLGSSRKVKRETQGDEGNEG